MIKVLWPLTRTALFGLCFLGGIKAVAGQSGNAPVYGLGDAPVDADELQRWPVVPLTRAYIPEAIDLSARFPPPGDQKNTSTCVSWSTGYAVRSYYALLETGAPVSDRDRIISPAYLHNVMTSLPTNGSCQQPQVNIIDALNVLLSYDMQPVSRYPEGNMCAGLAPSTVAMSGSRIKDAQQIARPTLAHGTGEQRSGLDRGSLDRMRIKLSKGHPILLSLLVGKRLMRLRASETYSGSVHDTGDIDGGHAVVLTGYDDRRSAFRMLNSWGSHWADGGYAWISYDTVLSDARYGFTMDTFRDPPRPQPSRPASQTSRIPRSERYECSELSLEEGPAGHPAILGFVSRQADRNDLGQHIPAGVDTNEVKLRPWPVCEALLTLREPLRAASRPKVKLIGGDRPLQVGETFSFEITPPDVPTFLYVFYLEDDGTVVNLAPRNGPVREQTPPNSPPLMFGDGKNGRQAFRVAPLKSLDPSGQPRAKGDPEGGHEAVIAVAARAPIQELEDFDIAGNRNYRVTAAQFQTTPGQPQGSADRLLLSLLKDIVFKRAGPNMLPREVSADVLHLRILD